MTASVVTARPPAQRSWDWATHRILRSNRDGLYRVQAPAGDDWRTLSVHPSLRLAELEVMRLKNPPRRTRRHTGECEAQDNLPRGGMSDRWLAPRGAWGAR